MLDVNIIGDAVGAGCALVVLDGILSNGERLTLLTLPARRGAAIESARSGAGRDRRAVVVGTAPHRRPHYSGETIASREDIRGKALCQTVNADEAGRVLLELDRLGYVRRAKLPEREGAGRRSERWEINPALGEG
jgi:hypothetical protein